MVDGKFLPLAAGDTAVWAPGESRTVVAEVLVEPTRATLVTPGGDLVFADKATCRELTSILVTPASASMQIGGTQTFTAAGYDQFNDPFDAEPFSWSSGAGTLTTLAPDSARLTAGTVSGTFDVTATSGLVSGTASVTIWPGPPASIVVAPDPANVVAGATQAFTATAYDQYGNENDTAVLTWSSTAGGITQGGLLTAQTAAQDGRSVSAAWNAVSGSAVVNVVPGPVSRIAVSPSTATILTGDSQTFSAIAYDQHDNVVGGTTFAWSATRGSVTTGGVYTAPATVGADTVTATANGVSGQATVTVRKEVHVDALQTYKSGVATDTFRKKESIETRVTVRDHDNALLQGVTVTIELRRPNGNLEATLTGTTDANGVASMTYELPASAPTGTTWVDRVTNLSGTDLVYASGANVITQRNFTVNP